MTWIFRKRIINGFYGISEIFSGVFTGRFDRENGNISEYNKI